MTAGEFLEAYAERSGMTPEALTAAGRVVVVCECDYALCEGWAMVPADVVWARDTVAVL